MTADYKPRLIKRRATAEEIEERHQALLDIAAEIQPATVRAIFYQATVRGVVEKTERAYKKVQIALAKLRLDGQIPFSWISDSTRFERRPLTFSDPSEAVDFVARRYRKSLWDDAPATVSLWLEKDALVNTIEGVTSKFDIPLLVSRGYASLTFLHDAAEEIDLDGRPAFVFHIGDHDPSGIGAAYHIEDKLREFSPEAEIHFERLAVLDEQIAEWDLPTRPTKASDTRSKGFVGASVELDAIDPRQLRSLVQGAIERHMPPEHYSALMVQQGAEKAAISSWANGGQA